MTETLGDRLRRVAADVPVPRIDLDDVVAGAVARRRRRLALVAGAAAVGTVAVATALATGFAPDPTDPAPVSPSVPPSASSSAAHTEDAPATRPLTYAEGTTVHVGGRTVRTRDPVAFVAATDDGAVYEAAYDGALWFTDGTTTSVIGTTGFTAAPTAHGGVVTTGDSGSLVVWDAVAPADRPADGYVVYDTARRAVVARIPHVGGGDQVVHVDRTRVYFSPQYGLPGCWVHDVRPCPDPHLFRFDVTSGTTTRMRLADLDAELGAPSRRFVAGAAGFDLEPAPGFAQEGRRLVPIGSDGEPRDLRTAGGEPVRLSLPDGFTPLGAEAGASVVVMSQWLDDDRVVVWANGGGGDLPAQRGDLLECRLPDGVCDVAVARSSHAYVAP